LAERYYDDYWRRPEPSPLSDPLRTKRVALACRELGRVKALDVLDAGCGAGEVVAELRRRGFRADGMEVSEVALELARRKEPRATFARHSAESVPWPYPASSYDAVVSFEVVEHLLQPAQLFAGAREVLKPRGWIGVTTPYHGRVKNLAISATRFDEHFDVEGDHIRFFSDRSLTQMVDRSGFDVIRVAHFGRLWPLWAGSFIWARRR